MKKLLASLVFVFFVCYLVFPVRAALTGEDILLNVEERMQPETVQLELDMELYSSGGDVRKRDFKVYKKNMGQITKSFICFLSPASIEGTTFLSLDKEDGYDNMYLYLPALGGVRKISSSQRNGNFVGTDFTFNDLTILGGGNYREDYKATILKERDQSFILKMIPVNSDINYKYVKMWVNSEHWYPVKIEFYDSSSQLFKILKLKNYEKSSNYWAVQNLSMKNVKQGTKTVITMKEAIYNEAVNDRWFTVRYLRRQ